MIRRTAAFAAGLLFIVVSLMWRHSWAQQLAVSPAYLELDLDEGRPSGTFVVTNVTDHELRCRAQTIHYVLSETGQLETIPPDQHSLAPWIKFNPKEFTLPPKATQNVRYSVIPNGKLETGEYWGGIYFEPLDAEKANLVDSLSGVTRTIRVIMSIVVPILGKYGDFEVSARVDFLEATVADTVVVIKSVLTNTSLGALRLGGEYDIVDSAGQIVATGKLADAFILPAKGLIMNTWVKQQISPGAYTARLRYHDRKTKRLLTVSETRFEIGKQNR
jgi:hypothetical protein